MEANDVKVLVVDDSSTMRRIIGQYLRVMGVADERIRFAADGAAGVAETESFAPDLVTMDVNMPGMNGLEALRRIMAQSRRPFVMMITTENGKEVVNDALKSGARDFLVKPFDQDTFHGKFERILRRLNQAAEERGE